MIQIVGIDCAVQDKNTGLVKALWDGCHLRILCAECGGKPGAVRETVAQWLSEAPLTLLAMDAPLGWPSPLGKRLVDHRAGAPIGETAHTLFRRETDRFIRQRHGKQPLEVGADRIARTAVAALDLLEALRQDSGQALPLLWSKTPSESGAIEVYPGATLRAMGVWRAGYRKREGWNHRQAMLKRLEPHIIVEADAMKVVDQVDVFDAVICALAGVDFLTGLAEPPNDPNLAVKEGWTWIRPPREES